MYFKYIIFKYIYYIIYYIYFILFNLSYIWVWGHSGGAQAYPWLCAQKWAIW